jgi:pimeloyl-ACP methyl ester carboxylesterase
MPIVQAHDGTKLYVKDWGEGPPVVLLHGWPLNADMWEYQAVALVAAGHRVVAYDRRGFGRSEQPGSGYDYDTFADDLFSVMGALGLENATLVGFSMGGGEVVRYFGRHAGQGAAKAVLIGAVPPSLLKGDGNPGGVDKSVFDDMIANLQKDRPHFLAGFGKRFFGVGPLTFSVSSEALDWALHLALMASPLATIECVRAFSQTDFRNDLAKVNVPTLVIHGDADAIVPIDASSRLTAAHVSGAELRVYAGAPHGLFFTHKDRLTSDLLSFAAR